MYRLFEFLFMMCATQEEKFSAFSYMFRCFTLNKTLFHNRTYR